MMKNIMTSPYRTMKVLSILPVFAFVLYAFAKPEYKYTNAGQIQAGVMNTDSTKKPPLPPAVVFKTDGPTPLYLVDGVVVTEAEATILNPEAIKSINVLKDKHAIEKYGKKGKNGVIEITTRKDDKEFENAAFPSVPPTVHNLKDSGKTPLVIIDGEIKTVDLEKIDPETIESVSVLNDKTATDKYGDKAKDGVIEIKTRIAQNVEIRSVTGVKPVVVVDGVVKDIAIDAIDPEMVESMSVLKDKDAIDKYGEKAKDGAIELVLKKDVQPNVKIENESLPIKVIKDVSVEKEIPVKK
jgi:hypothetical protein